MSTVTHEPLTLKTTKDLKPLLSANPPCLSAYLTLSTANGKDNALRWKEVVRSLEERSGGDPNARALISAIADWNALNVDRKPNAKSLAVFRSSDFFRVASLTTEIQQQAYVGRQFNVRPLLASERQEDFYLLALSLKNVRLLHLTNSSSEEVELPASASKNFDEWMNAAQPDHSLGRAASMGPSSGSSAHGLTSTSVTERESKSEYLAHFFRQLDRSVVEALRGHTETLVLAGVDHEVSQYRTINNYNCLSESHVHGAPNSLKAGDLHSRALEAIRQNRARRVDDFLHEYDHKVGGGASSRTNDIVTAAHDGRVLTLLVSESHQQAGTFDEATNQAHGGGDGGEDLLNDAIVQTILHAGDVIVAANNKMPNGAPLAAIFRF